ncbi:MAG: TMEM175 family protein [Prevotella sp.]
MDKNRLEAFSDGVIAIIVTIMVLELKVPEGASFKSLLQALPLFVSYLLSFAYVSIYWVNHHLAFTDVRRVTPLVLWANLHFLFWLSFIPFTTGWMSEQFMEPFPMAVYSFSLFMASVSFRLLEWSVNAKAEHSGGQRHLRSNGLREQLSSIVYLLCCPAAYLSVWIPLVALVTIAVWWIVPSCGHKGENADFSADENE